MDVPPVHGPPVHAHLSTVNTLASNVRPGGLATGFGFYRLAAYYQFSCAADSSRPSSSGSLG